MVSQYVDAKTFSDFTKNQDLMIQTFNHNITTLTNTVLEIKEKVAEFVGEFRVVKKIVWWILGIIGVLVVGGVLGSYMPTA